MDQQHRRQVLRFNADRLREVTANHQPVFRRVFDRLDLGQLRRFHFRAVAEQELGLLRGPVVQIPRDRAVVGGVGDEPFLVVNCLATHDEITPTDLGEQREIGFHRIVEYLPFESGFREFARLRQQHTAEPKAVLDGAQRVVSARGTALVGRGQFTLRIEPVSRMLMAGAPIVADVFAEDLLGKPVQAAVTIELDQDVWNPIERRTGQSARPLATLQGTTSALRGNVRATLSPATARAGYLTVRARAQDARGNKLVSECHIWVYDARVWDYGYRYPSFEAVPQDHELPSMRL